MVWWRVYGVPGDRTDKTLVPLYRRGNRAGDGCYVIHQHQQSIPFQQLRLV
jgi:hypothetical protein